MVVELARDTGPFGWYVKEAVGSNSRQLTLEERKRLHNDLETLGARISISCWAGKVERALDVIW